TSAKRRENFSIWGRKSMGQCRLFGIQNAAGEPNTNRPRGIADRAGGKLERGYFFFFFGAAATAWAAWVLAMRCWNLSTRPAVSTNFCWPVKKGWQELQIPTMITGLVERVLITLPQAQRTSASTYLGWIFSFIKEGENTIAPPNDKPELADFRSRLVARS